MKWTLKWTATRPGGVDGGAVLAGVDADFDKNSSRRRRGSALSWRCLFTLNAPLRTQRKSQEPLALGAPLAEKSASIGDAWSNPVADQTGYGWAIRDVIWGQRRVEP